MRGYHDVMLVQQPRELASIGEDRDLRVEVRHLAIGARDADRLLEASSNTVAAWPDLGDVAGLKLVQLTTVGTGS
jgi:hypothetical protein